ncbi:MAG: ATP-binding cassette domain-containing protein [Allgaiera sp.]|jgi:putative thiamine transport system ATP-binding protein|nr:ATP-binding cassette domain-containing protein [Allgaiera sp.]
MTGPVLELQDLTIVQTGSGAPLFPPLSLRVASGELVAVMGPSGVGKSTLISAIGGHLDTAFALRGRVRLDGTDITSLPAEARRIGVMFQEALLFPHLSVGDNLAFGLTPGIRGRRQRRAAVEVALDQAGLSGFYERDPATLSGGQRSRAALMRTLLARPKALLLDEPFSGLDAAMRDELRSFVFAHLRRIGIPTLIVSHDPEDAKAGGARIVTLDAGRAR